MVVVPEPELSMMQRCVQKERTEKKGTVCSPGPLTRMEV